MNMKRLPLVAAVGVALLSGASLAQAEVILYSFEDDDIDFVLDADGNPKTTGAFAEGDTLVSVFELPVFTIDGVNAIPTGQELTGVAAITLTDISDDPPMAGTVYTFGPSALPIDELPGYAGPDLDDGAALTMFFNGAPGAGIDRDLVLNRSDNPASNCTSLDDCIEQATLGTLYEVDGFAGDPDEFWSSTQILAGGGDIGTVLGTNNAILVSSYNLALSTLYNATGPVNYQVIATGADCGTPGGVADGCAQLVGSGTVSGGSGLSNDAVAHSDADLSKLVAVPEPATLALFGAGLLGLGFRSCRKA